MARTKSNGSKDSTATIGFEATALHGSGPSTGAATLRSLSEAKDNRSAMKSPKAKPQSLPGQRDIRRALIEADPVPVSTSTFELQPSNFTSALPGQLFYSTQISVCLSVFWKNDHAGERRAVSELESALAA